MIAIARPKKGPARLKKKGEAQTLADCKEYDLCPADYQAGRKRLKKHRYYSAKAVKLLLLQAHHPKCCFCEKGFLPANLHIEHFRPKNGFRQSLSQGQDELPGYYWLAYHWDNLLLSCFDCNSKWKKTFFPLANPRERARSHHDDISMERPLFLDPAELNPREHIQFAKDAPQGITRQGRMTALSEETSLSRRDAPCSVFG